VCNAGEYKPNGLVFMIVPPTDISLDFTIAALCCKMEIGNSIAFS